VDSRARGGDDRAVLEMWEELDMTTVARDSGLDQKLLQLLEQEEIRYEIIDGALVVNPPPGFSHEDWLMETAVQLRIVSPPDIAVLGSGFKYFYAALSEGNTVNHTMADITVVRRSDVEERGTVRPPLLVVEVHSPTTWRTDQRRKREIYESTGVATYLLLHPLELTLTVLQLQQGRYVEAARVSGPGSVVELEVPFPVVLRPFG
jgi:Uma2 family endonuclease